MNTISVEQKINAPINHVEKTLWDIQTWAKFWSPLEKVNIIYDDGFHQDFEMGLEWRNENVIVRTVRVRQSDGEIYFFSPTPPPPTTIHHGSWTLTEEKAGSVKLVATRWFLLPNTIDSEAFAFDFTNRLKQLVTRLAESCEK